MHFGVVGGVGSGGEAWVCPASPSFLQTHTQCHSIHIHASCAHLTHAHHDTTNPQHTHTNRLHGDVGKQERAAVLSKFMAGKLRVLVTTEVRRHARNDCVCVCV